MRFKTEELDYIKNKIDAYSNTFDNEEKEEFADILENMDNVFSKIAFTNGMKLEMLQKIYLVDDFDEIFEKHSLGELKQIDEIITDEDDFENYVARYQYDNKVYTDMEHFEKILDENWDVVGWEDIAFQYQGLCAGVNKPQVVELDVYETRINNNWASYDEFKDYLRYDYLVDDASQKIRSELGQSQKR
ncbi:hypothetical protein ACNQ2T_00925 [Mycoplasma sp. Z407A]|uniref:hypothetical protein n=1 Tax=Mycoplasma sp. Z407A TaxID=3401678 RepID=UPI003AAAFD49